MSMVDRNRKDTFQDSIERVLLDVIDLDDQESFFLALHRLRYLHNCKQTSAVVL
jgi:hypothetical protein